MADLLILPTRKWLRFQYTTIFIVLCVVVFFWSNRGLADWILVPPALLFLWPLTGSLRRRFTKVQITGDKLRYECGILSKTTRTIQISKIQDVTCTQTLMGRLMSIGNISIETAGETSRLTIANIDAPQQVADEILDAAGGKQSAKK